MYIKRAITAAAAAASITIKTTTTTAATPDRCSAVFSCAACFVLDKVLFFYSIYTTYIHTCTCVCVCCACKRAHRQLRETWARERRERRNLAILCAAFIHWMKREKQKYFLAKRKFSCVFACECPLLVCICVCMCVCILVCLPFVCVQIAHKFCSIVFRRKTQANPQDFHFWPLIAALWTAVKCFFFWGTVPF